MAHLLRVLIAAGGGAIGGAVAGFVAAVLSLQARRVRNSILAGRGQPGYKDCVLPIVFVPLCGIAGLTVGALLSIFASPVRAATIGALVPAGLLVLVTIVALAEQALRR